LNLRKITAIIEPDAEQTSSFSAAPAKPVAVAV
jgi:hypothetical protein